MRSQEWIDQRSLALHEAMAATREAGPALPDGARTNLQRWLNAAPRRPLLEWREPLGVTPLPRFLVLLRFRDAGAARARGRRHRDDYSAHTARG